MMKPITDMKDLFKVDMWLVELKCYIEQDMITAPPDVAGAYEKRLAELKEFLDRGLDD